MSVSVVLPPFHPWILPTYVGTMPPVLGIWRGFFDTVRTLIEVRIKYVLVKRKTRFSNDTSTVAQKKAHRRCSIVLAVVFAVYISNLC